MQVQTLSNTVKWMIVVHQDLLKSYNKKSPWSKTSSNHKLSKAKTNINSSIKYEQPLILFCFP